MQTSDVQYVHTLKQSPPKHTSSWQVQPSISRYTGDAFARLSSRPWISLMLSLMCGSLCQQPSIRSYTSLGQVLGRCSTLPWVIHSITCRGTKTRGCHKTSKPKKKSRNSSWNVSENATVSKSFTEVVKLTDKGNPHNMFQQQSKIKYRAVTNSKGHLFKKMQI